MAGTAKRITVVDSDGSGSDGNSGSDDDEPPPLEDMSDSIRFRKKFTERKPIESKRSTAASPRSTKADSAAAAKPPPVDRGQFAQHTNVSLHGLSVTKYNGCLGVVKGYDPETMRHEVKLESGKTLKIKPVNLKKAETFSGLGKGFFSRGKSGADDDDVEVLAPKKPGERPGQFSEVQEAMAKAAPFLEQRKDEWCTPDLLKKIENVPGIADALENPMFAQALTEFQHNPAVAMEKYGKNPQVAKFFQSFMGVMGSHLAEIGENEQGAGQGATGTTASPPGAMMQQQPPQQPDSDVMAALSKPGVKEALEDPRIKAMIQALQQNPQKSREIIAAARRDPDVAKKLMTLCNAGVLGMQQ
eukprot:m.150712 g.150712  ORF g.150712 m.150712 type:complete len:358 (+) comp23323_c0_seq2:69-1142(+)